ncbi:MAG: helix-turn-helix transcriptional regulator [Clostridia bacterium]|nr:helix-turn-helix transcriptional regulator [Clostridia bacterium]
MFGFRLKELRVDKGFTQKKLAEKLECSQSMIARWEKGECDATGEVIKKVALLFNVSADYLLGLTD